MPFCVIMKCNLRALVAGAGSNPAVVLAFIALLFGLIVYKSLFTNKKEIQMTEENKEKDADIGTRKLTSNPYINAFNETIWAVTASLTANIGTHATANDKGDYHLIVALTPSNHNKLNMYRNPMSNWRSVLTSFHLNHLLLSASVH